MNSVFSQYRPSWSPGYVATSRPSLLKDIIKLVALNIIVSLGAIVFDYYAPLLALGIRLTIGLGSLIYLFARYVPSQRASYKPTVVIADPEQQSGRSSLKPYNFLGSSVAGQSMFNASPRQVSAASPSSGGAGHATYNPGGSSVAGQPMFTPPTRQEPAASPSSGGTGYPTYNTVGSSVAGQPMFTPPRS